MSMRKVLKFTIIIILLSIAELLYSLTFVAAIIDSAIAMDIYQFPAGIVYNEAAQLERARLKTEPPSRDVPKPTFPFGIDQRPNYPEHYGWNPVYWSDYPKQPMWTVPLPKIAAPVVSRNLPDFPELPCHRPPTEYTTPDIYPAWIPDIPKWSSTFNPHADEHNRPFKHLVGPPTLLPVGWVEKLNCP